MKKKTTKTKTKRANNRPPAVQTSWCQVRITAQLAAAVDQLAVGEKSRVVREALEAACKEARIPLRPRNDPKQLALPIVKRALKPPTKSRAKVRP